jgi:hypothetical protein
MPGELLDQLLANAFVHDDKAHPPFLRPAND